jgi:hypothetical protein
MSCFACAMLLSYRVMNPTIRVTPALWHVAIMLLHSASVRASGSHT